MRGKNGKLYRAASLAGILLAAGCIWGTVLPAEAKAKERTEVPQGVTVNGTDLSGCSMEDLTGKLEDLGAQLLQEKITLSIGDNEVEKTIADLGVETDLAETEEKIRSVGNTGNIVARYKALKDTERDGLNLGVDVSWDKEQAETVLDQICGKYEEPAQDYGLTRENGVFTVVDGKAGYQVSREKARETILDALEENWDGSGLTVQLELEDVEPKGSEEELAQVQDLLGACTTSYASSSSARAKNVERGASLVNGTVLYPGESCSFYNLVAPIQLDNGYFMAPSYASGEVVESPGGGICQVSTTLYGALLEAELEIDERSNHSMLVAYVDPSKDAAIAGTYKDLKFTNNLDQPVYIEGQTGGRQLTFRIYGVESRPSNRRVEYKSVELEDKEPTVVLTANWGAAAGSIATTDSGHRGCEAKLVKCVYVDDQLVEETDFNTSSYRMSSKKISIGMVTDNPDLYAALQAAVEANDLDAVKAALAVYGTGSADGTAAEGTEDAAQSETATQAAVEAAP